MDINTIANIGDTNSKEYIVKLEDTAHNIGNRGVTMLSTPAMIKYMESAAANIVFSKLPNNYRPVGTKINIEHINPTPVGMKVTVNAKLIAIEGKMLRYEVEAFNEKCKIGFGTCEQHVINLDKFLNKNQSDL